MLCVRDEKENAVLRAKYNSVVLYGLCVFLIYVHLCLDTAELNISTIHSGWGNAWLGDEDLWAKNCRKLSGAVEKKICLSGTLKRARLLRWSNHQNEVNYSMGYVGQREIISRKGTKSICASKTLCYKCDPFMLLEGYLKP